MIGGGICHLACIPIRKEPGSVTEMVTQLLFGETYKVIDKQESWMQIRCDYDGYEGWMAINQFCGNANTIIYKGICNELLQQVNFNNQIIHVTVGASIEGKKKEPTWENIEKQALIYINAPYLWGGRSPFGIDCSGFTQVLYKSIGVKLLRDANQQATEGETVDFAATAKPGDLAFFDNDEGRIIHVGMIWNEEQIIHAHGKVRIDKFDQSGIYNIDNNSYSHKLRIIKRV